MKKAVAVLVPYCSIICLRLGPHVFRKTSTSFNNKCWKQNHNPKLSHVSVHRSKRQQRNGMCSSIQMFWWQRDGCVNIKKPDINFKCVTDIDKNKMWYHLWLSFIFFKKTLAPHRGNTTNLLVSVASWVCFKAYLWVSSTPRPWNVDCTDIKRNSPIKIVRNGTLFSSNCIYRFISWTSKRLNKPSRSKKPNNFKHLTLENEIPLLS